MSKSPKKVLGLFSLVMINIIAIDNLRSISLSAEYGLSVVGLYLLVGICFFIPSALIAAELATAWPTTGGIYIWVREAFGKKIGFLIIWLQWVYNIVWYPTVAIFISGTLAYLINPHLVNNKIYMVSVTLGVFWLATIVNCYGMRFSSFVSTIGALFGTLLPIAFIILLGSIWLLQGHHSQIAFTWSGMLPNFSHWNQLPLLVAIVFGLIGIEMSAAHAGEVKNPQHAYPRAALIAVVIILVSLILSPLAIAIIIPQPHLDVITGLIQGFTVFFQRFHMPWMGPVMIITIIIGSLTSIAAWIIGPTKGIMAAGQDGSMPSWMAKQNRHGAPVALLCIQGFIVTALCIVFLLLPTVKSSYWYLSDLTAQLALLSYIGFFAAAVRLHHTQAKVERAFRVPGGKIGMWCAASLGIFSCIFAIGLGFIPPVQIAVGNTLHFELLLVGGILVFLIPPFLLIRYQHRTIKHG